MTERERPRESDPYWQRDIGLFEGRFRSTRDEPMIVRARVHQATERYTDQDIHPDIVPVASRDGSRTYIHMQPYLALPDIRLTVALSPAPDASGAIGEVVGAEEAGIRREQIGTGRVGGERRRSPPPSEPGVPLSWHPAQASLTVGYTSRVACIR